MNKEKFNAIIKKIIAKMKDFFEKTEPYAERFLSILETNGLYIIWFLIYFLFTCLFLSLFLEKGILFLCCICIYIATLLIAHYFGDTIFKLLEGAREIETRQEKEYLNPIFEDVYQDIKEQYVALPEIDLYIIDTLTVNAMAIGSHTIAVTQGAIETFNPEELKGVIAHEIAHIYYGDGKMAVLNTIGNGIFALIAMIIKLVLKAIEFTGRIFESTAVQVIFGFIRFIFEMCLFSFLWLGNLILSFNSRGNELKSDKFAYETGYGEQLTKALYLIQKMSLGQKVKLVSKMTASHPRTSKRNGQLEALEDGELDG